MQNIDKDMTDTEGTAKVNSTARTNNPDVAAQPMQTTENPYRRADEVADERVATDEAYTDEALVSNPNPAEHDELEDDTSVNKGTDTFEEGVVESEHVNDNDNPARQPDRRDQPGNGFDDNINEETVGSEAPDSDKINDFNRYATIDNAQTRVLNPDEKQYRIVEVDILIIRTRQ